MVHVDIVAKHEGGNIFDLWKEIESHHVQKDATVHHEMWSLLFADRKVPDDCYLGYLWRGSDIENRIDRLRPLALSGEQILKDIMLFAQPLFFFR